MANSQPQKCRPWLAALLLSGCAALAHAQPQTPRPAPEAPLPPALVGLPSLGLAGEDALSLRDERTLGLLLWREVRNDAAFVQDPLVTAYLQRFVARMATGLPLEEQGAFKVFAVADSQLNAFAMPGRILGVHSGLMLGVAREGELAAVLAHEIAHVSQRHFARRVADQKSNQWIGWAGMAAALLAARNAGNASSASNASAFEGALLGSQALLASKQLAFSRDMEREADALGLQLLQGAGYDGADMVRMLRRLAAGASLNDSGNGYARSHPGTGERMAGVEGRLRSAGTPPGAQDQGLDFLLAQARLRAVTAISGDDRAIALRSFEQAALSPHENLRLAAQYGAAVMALRGNARSATTAAHAALIAARRNAAFAAHPWVAALSAELAHSLAFAAPVFAAPPAYPELAHVQALLALSAAKQADAGAKAALLTAEAALKRQLKALPYSDLAWTDLASVNAALDRPAHALYAQAESLAAQGAWVSALSLIAQAIQAANRAQLIDLQAAWVQRENAMKNGLAEERALEQKQK